MDWSHAHIWQDAPQSALADAETAVLRLEVPAEVSATVGDAGYELRSFSETVDLVVVGSRRWGPVARLVTGGVGETLVSDASCSLLVVPRAPARGRDRVGQRRERRPAVA